MRHTEAQGRDGEDWLCLGRVMTRVPRMTRVPQTSTLFSPVSSRTAFTEGVRTQLLKLLLGYVTVLEEETFFAFYYLCIHF